MAVPLGSTCATSHLKRLGPSSDGRTNRWRVTCPRCETTFEPETTMFRSQSLECPSGRCKAHLVAQYNDGLVVVIPGNSR